MWASRTIRRSRRMSSQRSEEHTSELQSQSNLVCRLLLEKKNSFSAPGEEQALKIVADLRRQVFLVFKEAVNNVARHSKCTEAQIELRIETRSLTMKVAANGAGFDPAQIVEGQGLASMRARAKGLGGKLQIISNDDSGTTILLRVPLSGRVTQRDGRGR